MNSGGSSDGEDSNENYKSIVIFHESEVIGTGSIFIRKCGK